MIPQEKRRLFEYIAFWMMYSIYVHDEGAKIQEKVKELYNKLPKTYVDEVYGKVARSAKINSYLRQNGVPSKYYF